ncbi:hypothetical protein C8R43DRAFT_194710 [Mycena crocata]|nr:hypothetical protein C8R43DRAFT_194710 [Mycena crocata]
MEYARLTRTQVANLVCTKCGRKSEKGLCKCSKCKRVAYCDAACQKREWRNHKILCTQFQKLNEHEMKKGYPADLKPADRLEYHLLEQSIRCNIFRDANEAYPYGRFEVAFVTYEKKCRVCFRTPFRDANHTFVACSKCELAWKEGRKYIILTRSHN